MQGGDPFDIAGRAADDLVARDPGQPAGPVAGLTITGFLADSERAGYRRIYFDGSLERFVEFAVDDVIDGREIPAEEPPFVGERATTVTLRPEAHVDVGRTVPADAFDLQPTPGDPIGIEGADRVFEGGSDDCYSRRYTCTRMYCADLAYPDVEVRWPRFRPR